LLVTDKSDEALMNLATKLTKDFEFELDETDTVKMFIFYKQEIQLTVSLLRDDNAYIINHTDLLFGCSGKDVLENADFTRGFTFCSASSGDRESKQLLLAADKFIRYQQANYVPGYTIISVEKKAEEEKRLIITLKNNVTIASSRPVIITLMNYGLPLNFTGEIDAVHPCKIQIARGLKLAAILQGLQYLSDQMQMHDLVHRLMGVSRHRNVKLSAKFQYFILWAFRFVQKQYRQILQARPSTIINMQTIPDSVFEAEAFSAIQNLSQGAEAPGVDFSKVNKQNKHQEFDNNHTVHIIQRFGIWQLALAKHGKEVPPDLNLLQKFTIDSDKQSTVFDHT